MTPSPFEVLVFSSANLFRALSNERCDVESVAAQRLPTYLLEYLTKIKARSIVVEHKYTDGDYLEDYAAYYVRCHEPYDRLCKRLHFFSCDIAEEDLRRACLGQLSEAEGRSFCDAYLGFVVARPLPNAIIGRSLLATYPPRPNDREYPAVRKYYAHLFGVELTIHSLPYQEQDSVLAACATVALWSAFHMTAHLFQSIAPRPAEITRMAVSGGHYGRSVPSHGLQIEEMCLAVSRFGLEPELIDLDSKNVPLHSLAYAYLRMKVPVILVLRIDDQLHAITLNGYSLAADRPKYNELTSGASSVPMIGARIDAFYGHDDQVGPFAKLQAERGDKSHPLVFTSPNAWRDKNGKPLTLEPAAVLIPVYHKIRVTFLEVQEWLWHAHALALLLGIDPHSEIEWDVFLAQSNDLKAELRESQLQDATREAILFEPQPRFVWRATARVLGTSAFELIFDATDMSRNFPLRYVIWHNNSVRGALKVLIEAPAIQASLTDVLTPAFVARLKESLR